MNKMILGAVLVVVLAAAFLGTAEVVYAQTGAPLTSGAGMMGGRGPRGGTGNQDGILHDAMMTVYAQKLGLTVEEIETRLNNGETMAQIAYAKGLTAEQFTTLMTDARTQALDQAVKDGTLTQEQADWMKQRGSRMSQGNGMRGAGQGRNSGVNADCPYYNQ